MWSTITVALVLLVTGAPRIGAQPGDVRFCAPDSAPAVAAADQQPSAQTFQYNDRVNVTVADAPIFLYMDTKRTPLTSLKQGTVLRVLEVEGDWIFVEFEDARWGTRLGYVERKNVGTIKANPSPAAPPTRIGEPEPVAKPPVQAKPATPAKATTAAPAQAPPPTPSPQTTAPPAPSPRTAPAPTSSKSRAAPPRPKDPDPFSMALARFGYFIAADPAYKAVYRNGVSYGGEARIALGRSGRPIVAWFEGNYRTRTGSFTFTKETTRLKVTSVEGGAIYRISRGRVAPYVGAGVGYYIFNENNEPIGEAKQNKVGFCGVGGFSVMVAGPFVLDLRVKYSSARMQPADFGINVGGATAGLGAGVRF